MTCVFGVLNVFFASISWMFEPYGLDGTQTGIVLIAANIVGCVGCVTMSLIFGS